MSLHIALLGTMSTSWRTDVAQRLRELGCVVHDNTNSAWTTAVTAEQILPLLAEDMQIVRLVDMILWFHAAGTPGNTARIELGYLGACGHKVVVCVEPGVTSRPYMEAYARLCLMHWVESFEEAYRIIETMFHHR